MLGQETIFNHVFNTTTKGFPFENKNFICDERGYFQKRKKGYGPWWKFLFCFTVNFFLLKFDQLFYFFGKIWLKVLQYF